MKIVLNKGFGGFELSKSLYQEMGMKWDGYGYMCNGDLGIESDDYIAYRTSPKLIKAIEKIGVKEASGEMAVLEIVEIPDDIEWEIDEYDGFETVHEQHRKW